MKAFKEARKKVELVSKQDLDLKKIFAGQKLLADCRGNM
jgi:hypothetical protein